MRSIFPTEGFEIALARRWYEWADEQLDAVYASCSDAYSEGQLDRICQILKDAQWLLGNEIARSEDHVVPSGSDAPEEDVSLVPPWQV